MFLILLIRGLGVWVGVGVGLVLGIGLGLFLCWSVFSSGSWGRGFHWSGGF